ncbi:thiamine pyrophosphate-dependent dehydrogenase E1 component subunit alpha [Actinoplanes sp. NPDC048796]|uniref:thiamine pyrophosphate-dependent dehydrogenase E1 component subunit alpha n=1 Tax=unclassified Actinoplanes TaxID=2626549 RepID=UPI0033E5A510
MTTPTLDDDLDSLLLIRHFEQRLLDLFAAGELNGTTHTCLGQEHVPVALSALLAEGDFVLSNHRGHGHYLARYDDPAGLLAEIMGRRGGVCDGVGGSQHLFRDGYLSTGVQGESLPVGVGIALSLRRSRPGSVVVAYIGDGTWGEGAVYEALNMAALWRAPLIVAVEHNGIAQTTPTEAHLAGTIGGRCAGFGIRHRLIEGNDVAAIRATLAPAVSLVRAGGEPLVIEFRAHRLGPHSKGDDTRTEQQLEAARRADWYPRLAAAAPESFAAADRRQRDRVAAVVDDVRARPVSEWRRQWPANE